MHPKHTKDLSDEFFIGLDEMCTRLGTPKAAMLGVMMSESGVSASKRNPGSSATGLIQFMAQKDGRYFGMTRDQFGALPAHEQLRYVEAHFRPYVGKLNTVAAIYLAVFLPAQIDLAVDPDAVVVAKGGPYGWAYAANSYFDFDANLKITVRELEESVGLQCDGPRWEEICRRAGLPVKAHSGAAFDLRTTLGVQQALQKLGFDPGPLDGFPGPRTTAALVVFQRANGEAADGVPGPRTRASLKRALRMRGVQI